MSQVLLEVLAGSRSESRVDSAGRRAKSATRRQSWDTAVVGRVVAAGSDGVVSVDFPGNPAGRALSARAAVMLSTGDVGAEVVLLFERADPARPIVVARLLPRGAAAPAPAPNVGITCDGERLTLSADREVVLTCGEASITLTRAGKVLIRGHYLSTRSSGVNRIKGGSVQIN